MIAKDKVVSIHYTLKNDDSQVLDSSEGRDPLAYIHGYGYLIPGLETELNGKTVGDKFTSTITPEHGYGLIDDKLVHKVAKANFKGEGEVQIGMQVKVETNDGPKIATVKNVVGEDVTLDLNHPLAGINLNFDVEVTGVRDATKEELDHGHVHGKGGVEH
ncbi:MAG: FKBP-type peptidyl-prolyl cis-trans isomerase [Bacteroidia bacterium]